MKQKAGFTPLKNNRSNVRAIFKWSNIFYIFNRSKYLNIRSLTGFTLIELLLAVTLTAIISFSVYSLFSSSIRVVLRMNGTSADEDLNIFCEKFERDLENLVRYHSILFTGTPNQFSFATPYVLRSNEGLDKGVGRLTFFYDLATKTIQRRQDNMSQIYLEKLGSPIPIFSRVASTRFSYFAYDTNESQYRWFEEYNETALPRAVRIQLEFLNGDRKIELTRTFFIPLGD